ncbi:MAG: 50S ribosomal protein L5 [bacterium]|nr:50S ribosomal protein L5 [bacterium]
MVPRIKELHQKTIIPEMMKKYNLKNKNQVPVLDKIVLNCGVGEAKENPKLLTAAAEELSIITGQKAVILKAKKAISNFKIKKGIPIACKVTLRENRMWEFFDRFVNIALPRVRDFKGVNPDSFDRFNHYTIGLKEQIIFPEIDYDKVEKIHGMDITFVVKNNKNKEWVREFLTMAGMPFKK